MDGELRATRVPERETKLVTDLTSRGGLVARAGQVLRRMLGRRPEADVVSPLELPIAMPARRPPWAMISFIACVVLPGVATVLYLAFIASDQYIAETRAVVRAVEQEALPSSSTSTGTSSSGSGSSSGPGSSTAYATTTPNAYIVTNYIRSRAMVDALGKTLDLRAIFRRPEADFWARLESDASVEDLVDHWKRVVTTYVDGPSGIVTIKIRAFRRDDALELTQAVVKLSEQLVNEISERARRDSMRFAEQEVRRGDARVRAALLELRRYRDEAGLIDPVKAADETSKLLMQLMAEKIRLESDLFVASRTLNRNAPSIQTLTSRVEIVELQIAKLKGQLTGESADARNVAASLARFEELEVQRQFSERLYTMAQDGLERARITAERQSVYFAVFVPPALPEESQFPRRVAYSFLVPLALMVLWSIVALIWASVLDHRT
ncbi:MAG TPA: capsule biosynthesis protein [Vineibacter sp.]|nr:capsule biosynthesis protein [Vineibacter sp.]